MYRGVCRPSGQHIAQHPAAQQQQQHLQHVDQGRAAHTHANALQPPAQHMMQGLAGPAAQPMAAPAAVAESAAPVPMATTQIGPSMSTDIDMDNVESSADSILPRLATLQVGLSS
jgi:hypothetical protein